MKIHLFFQKGIGIHVERTPDEYRLIEQKQLFNQQIKISKLPAPKSNGDTFNNCTITNREPVIVPQPQPFMVQQQAKTQVNQETLDRANEYVAMQTGFTSDMVEKVLHSALQFFKDKGLM